MSHLESALEWLRPLIYGSYTWDYCVLWKLGDDPSRFIELVDCCCNGGEIKQKGIKKMKTEQNVAIPLCKDGFNVHPANTKACEALAKLPSSLPLYSGLHGEVVISGQPKWHKIATKSEPTTSQEDCIQTRVLIPVLGGLIELFSANNIPEDQRAVEIVRAQFAAFSETETMSTSSISFEGHSMINPSLNQAGILPLTQIPVTHQHNFPNFDRSSTSSLPSDENTSPDSNPCSVSQNPTLNPSGQCGKDDATEQHKCKSKNYFTERRRRNRISEGMLTLRALVPEITKMNRAATLGDAIDYIEELKNQVEELKFELNNMEEEEDRCMIASGLKVPGSNEEVRERPNLGVQVVDGDQVSSGKLLLKMKCQQIPGAFTELLEALGSSGVRIDDVTDANVTTCNGAMWSTFIIQTNGKDLQVKDLVRSLTSTTA